MTRLLVFLFAALTAASAQAFPSYASGEGFRGAELMMPEERQNHVVRLRSMQTFAECEAYMTAHEQELQTRAKARNVILPPRSGDPCAVMRTFGRIR